MSVLPTYRDVEMAAARLDGAAIRTPAVPCPALATVTGALVFLKAECLQRTGSFKFRGAYNAVAAMSAEDRAKGVLTFSSGNHGQAIALAASLHGTSAVVVMPMDAPVSKIAATRKNGAEVILYDRATQDREAIAGELQRARGLTLIPPFNHRDVIAGQGTAAKELIEDVGPLDFLFVCVGGGGLISGSALSANMLAPECRVIGAEPAAGDDAARSFRSGRIESSPHAETIADGARTVALGALTYEIIRSRVDDFITVSDRELLDARQIVAEDSGLVIEPTGALAAAGVFKWGRLLAGKRVGVIISGGNGDFDAPFLPLDGS